MAAMSVGAASTMMANVCAFGSGVVDEGRMATVVSHIAWPYTSVYRSTSGSSLAPTLYDHLTVEDEPAGLITPQLPGRPGPVSRASLREHWVGDLGSPVGDHRNAILEGLEGKRFRPVWSEAGVVEPNIELPIRKGGRREASCNPPEPARLAARAGVDDGPAAQAECTETLKDLPRVSLPARNFVVHRVGGMIRRDSGVAEGLIPIDGDHPRAERSTSGRVGKRVVW